jgi:DNA-binding MarR family transcriptional regulator
MSSERVLVLLERIGNLLRGERRRVGAAHGLQPVQLEALHYLTLCNRFSDTPQAVSEYLGLTKGTVSQSVKVLETRGMVRKRPDARDRRLVHLRTTAKGRRVVAALGPGTLTDTAWIALPARLRGQLTAGLEALLSALLLANDSRSFGVCRSCRHNRRTGPDQSRCELLDVELNDEDITRICREHEST